MKHLIRILLFGLIPTLSFSQIDLERRLTKRVVDCEDIAMNCSELFVQFIESNQLDSAEIVLDFWEGNCGVREPVNRGRILLSMITSELTETLYDSTVFQDIDNFITRTEFSKRSDYRENYEYYAPYYGFIPLNSYYDRKTKEIAKRTKNHDNDLERLFSLLYAEKVDEFYYQLQDSVYEDYIVRKEYDKEIKELKKLPDGHFDISLGAFVPTSNADLLGVHPTLGFSGGIKFKKITYDLTIDMRFGSTKNEYTVLRPDTFTTDYFFGAYFGIDLSYDLLRYKRSELLLLAGVGMDGFDTEFTNSDTRRAVSVFSGNLNGGLMYRCYYNDKNYIGISYQYNLVDYNSDKIVDDLTGNFHSIAISFGGLSNPIKQEGFKRLRYLE
jgi:hypothetical protein